MIRQRYMAEFEALGPDGVKSKIREGAWHSEQLSHAQQWLAEQSQDLSETILREQISIARDASDAASRAADAAERQALVAERDDKKATIALIVAAIAAIAAIADIIVPHYWK